LKCLISHTVFLLLVLLYSFSGNAQLGWEFVNEISDANKVEVNVVKSDVANSCVYIGGVFTSDLSSVFTTGLNGTPDFSTNYGGVDGFVAKYLEDGTFVWAFMLGGIGADVISDLDVDASGDIYITGSFDGAAEFRGTEVTSYPNVLAYGGIDIFQAKYDAAGKFQWLHEGGGGLTDNGTHVKVDGARVIFAGNYEISGSTSIAGLNPITYGGNDVFVMGRDLSGALLWFCDGGSNADDDIGGISIEADTVYMAMNFSGASMTHIDYGLNFAPAQPNTTSGLYDISYVALSANTGLYSWVNQIGSTDNVRCADMIGDASSLIMVGSYKSDINLPVFGPGPANASIDIFTTSLKNDLGTCQWLATEPTIGATDAVGTCLAFDQLGNIWIGAEFNGTVNVNGVFPVTSGGGTDLLTVEYDISGAYQYHISTTAGTDIDVNDISISGTNEVFLGGATTSNSTFGTITTSVGGAQDGYLAKIGFCDASFAYSAASYCSGNPNELPIITGNGGGLFTEGSGNITFLSTATGEIDLTASTVGGPYTITYTAPIGCSQTFNVSITANANPVFTSCPINISSANDVGLCSAIVTYTVPVATDDCGTPVVTQTDGSGLSSGSAFPVGITSIQYTATDLAGNTTLCSFNVTITDTEIPVISCPGNIIQGNDI